MFQAQPISSHHKPSVYQGFPNHIVIIPFSHQPFYYNLMRNSCPPIIHNSWLVSPNHTHSYQTFITILKSSMHKSHKARKVIPHCTVSLSPSPRLRGLAQARRARSGEPPLRLGEDWMVHSGNITGSRLSEIPLAWARRSLAQEFKQVAWATSRVTVLGELPVSSRLGEIDSLERDLQVSPLFSTVTATYLTQPSITSILITQKRRMHSWNH